jgi:outer membrane protein, heavy metal efflux system
MRNRYRPWVVLLSIACAIARPAPTRAQSTGLTLDQVVATAVERSKRLTAARAQIDAARGELQQSRLRSNPMIDVSQSEEAGGPGRRTALGLTWPMELFRVPARSTIAERQIDVATLDAARVEWELASRVRQAAVRVLGAVRALTVIEQQASAARTLRDLVAGSVAAGALPRLDRDVAEVDLRRLEASVRIAEGEVAAEMAALKGVMGISQDEPLALRPIEDEVSSIVAATEAQLAAPAADRPDLAVSKAELRAAEAQTNLARQEGRWDVSFAAGYSRTDMSFPQLGLDAEGRTAPIAGRFHDLSLSATITVPWRNRNQGAVAAATARVAAASASQEAMTIEAAADLAASRARWTAAREAIDRYRDGLLELARQNLDVIQQTYLAGRGTLNDVTADRRRLLDLEMAYAGLLQELLAADNDLRRAMGALR